MLASSFLDPVLGIDVHFEMVPTPAPVPTPIPNPFIGVVFDPLGLAAGIAIGAAIGAVVGAPFQGPVLYWTAFPATNTGTEAKHVPGHIIIPPGTLWAPFPKTPKPVIHPGETPKPALPVKPENDAVVITGSKTVTVMGSNAVRLGDIALSCSEPLRLPSSVVLAVPKGAPILIGGPPSLDIMAALMASLRTRFVSDSLHALLSRLKPSRFRNFMHRVVCFFTGHPVDVASGKVMTEFVDIELPGPLPLKVERIYSSAFASRPGPVGHGWSLSLDQAIWRERGKVVLLAEDGREIEFDTFDFPQHRIEPGQRVYEPINRLTLHCEKDGAWRVVDHEGVVREFGQVPGRSDGRAMIQRIRSRCGFHEITFHYGMEGGKQPSAVGRLEWVRDSGGRFVHLRWDAQGRVTEMHLPQPQGEGFYRHRRYEYDAAGDLVGVTDSLGHAWRFAYVTHLLTQETDRNGLSFYFAYDGLGEDAWCVRTWGDGGIYDHVLSYDKHKHVTFVTNSLGFTTQYHMNLVGHVVKIVDPLGGETKYEYDPATLQRTAATDAVGNKVETGYDTRGNLTGIELANGASIRLEFDSAAHPTRATDPRGGQWTWLHDRDGYLRSRQQPDQFTTTFSWQQGLMVAEQDALLVRRFSYDAHKNLTQTVTSDGSSISKQYDNLGRATKMWLDANVPVEARYDTEGNVCSVTLPDGTSQRFEHDREGNLISAETPHRRVTYEYGGRNLIVGRSEGDERIRLIHDTETQLVAVVDEAQRARHFRYDAAGRLEADTTPSEGSRTYRRDPAGQTIGVSTALGRLSSLSYGPTGRIVEMEHSDGTFSSFEYDERDLLIKATNEDDVVEIERDSVGRITSERCRLAEIAARHAFDSTRIEMSSSLGARLTVARDPQRRVEELHIGKAIPDSRPDPFLLRRSPIGRILELRSQTIATASHHDALDRPLTQTILRSRGPGTTNWDEVSRVAYQWQADDRVSSIADSVSGTWRKLSYDRSKRLVVEERPEGTVTRPREEPSKLEASELRDGHVVRIAGAELVHDRDGFLVQKIDDAGTWAYTWNGHGLLKSVRCPTGIVVEHAYDALARRIRKTVLRPTSAGSELVYEVRFVWDHDVLLHEMRSDRPLLTWYHDPRTSTLIACESTAWRRIVVTDHLGVVSRVHDDDGRTVWSGSLDILGRPHTLEGDIEACPWRWPGQYADLETGLYYNRFRYYDPEIGRYISPDPLGILGGLHAYAYVDDPLLGLDPWGLVNLRDLGDHDLFEHINEVMYRNKRDAGGGGRHGIIHRVREQITGAMRPGSTGWATHEDQIRGAQKNLRDALDEWSRRGLPMVDRNGDELFKDARRLATMDPPTGKERDVPKKCR